MDGVRELFARDGRKASEIIDRESPSIGLSDFVMSKETSDEPSDFRCAKIPGKRRWSDSGRIRGPDGADRSCVITIITNLHSESTHIQLGKQQP